MRNFGDDLFCFVAHQGQKRYWPQFSSKVLAPQIGGLNVPCTVSKNLQRAYESSSIGGGAVRLVAAVSAALSSEKLVYAGGSIITGRLGVRSIVSRLGAAMSGIGVSIGPFSTDKYCKRAQELLANFEYLAVRDATSLGVAQELGVQAVLAADLAGLIPLLYTPSLGQSSSRRRILFVPCSNSSDGSLSGEAFCKAFVEGVAHLKNAADVEICVLALNSHPKHGDARLVELVVNDLRSIGMSVTQECYGGRGMLATIDLIASSSVVVTGRLHGAIVAYSYGVPFVLNEYHRKCRDFLDDVQLERATRLIGSGMAELVCEALNKSWRPGLDPREYCSRAETNFTIAPWFDRECARVAPKSERL